MREYLSSEERQDKIVTLLSQKGRLSVAGIVGQFGVSQATARRDLETLAEQGKLHRVHGGALSMKQAPPELPILQRAQEQTSEKQRIGLAAAALVGDGDTIFLGSGTTVLEVARNLRSRQNLSVITNSLPVMNLLSGLPGINLITLGGMLRLSELSFIGHITEQSLAEVRADKVFIGVHAICLKNGLTNDYLPETMTDRAILKAGNEVIVVADHTKINAVATAFLAPIDSIDALVTDNHSPADFLGTLQEMGIKIYLA